MADSSHKKGRYTKYSNKIGLHSNSKGGFIKNDTDVVLSFPFKDTVLEAGMSKEDVGREERFLHIEVDRKDIDTLEEPKVLTDFKLVDKNGEKQLTADDDIEFFDEEGKLKRSLLIKGNNLLALHTLTSRLAGQVKLIYIDPPYNTGGDGFKYNDKFNHSAWLAFMKNRLEVAKELLRDDGSIFIQCDDNEQAYLRVLMDEIYGRDNFYTTIVWRKRTTAPNDRPIGRMHEYIHIASKNMEKLELYLQPRSEESKARYQNPDNDPRGAWVAADLSANGKGNRMVASLVFPITNPATGQSSMPGDGKCWLYNKEKISKYLEEGRIGFREKSGRPFLKRYLSEVRDGVTLPTILNDAGFSSNSSQEMKKLFDDDRFEYPKPEKLMQTLIQSATQKGDIILDFCLGSGTTSAVAHKMGRYWIGIEQMDYIENVAMERMKKVVTGDAVGISEDVNWSGGGSFVYFEMKKYNQEYVDRITQATSLSELEDIYVEMRNNAFLKFWFDRKEFEKDENFRNLDIEKRKQKLIDVLDENQLYLNYADMNDTRHKVNEDEKVLTDKFYGTAEN